MEIFSKTIKDNQKYEYFKKFCAEKEELDKTCVECSTHYGNKFDNFYKGDNICKQCKI